MQSSAQELGDVRKLVRTLMQELERARQSPRARRLSRALAQNLGCLVLNLLKELAKEPPLAQKLATANQLARQLAEDLNSLVRENWRRAAE